MRRVGSYRNAVEFMVWNDDTEWATEEAPSLSVAASLVAYVFERSNEEVTRDVLAERQRRALDMERRSFGC